MGCNYYFKPNPEPRCPTCKRSLEETESVHIGKSSSGWSFEFHGTKETRSYKDWLKLLEAGGEIVADNEVVALEHFKALVESKRGGRKHALEYPSEQNWLDDEGNSFSGYEFS